MTFNNFGKSLSENKIIVIILIIFLAIIILWSNNFFTKNFSSLPEPYNQYDYLYSIRDTNNNTISAYFNNKLIIKENEAKDGVTRLFPLFDGTGFYKIISPNPGATISCRGEKLTGAQLGGKARNSMCIVHNRIEYISHGFDWPFYADKSIVIYEACEHENFYESMGDNGCSKMNLKINDEIIDSQVEGYEKDDFTGEKKLVQASRFQNVRVDGNKVIYHKWDYQREGNVLVSYDLKNKQKVEYPGDRKGIMYSEIEDQSLAFLLWNDEKSTQKNFYYKNQIINNIDSFTFYNNNFYFVESSDKKLDFKKDNILLRRYAFDGHTYNIGIYPYCDRHAGFCLYDQDNYSSVFCDDYKENRYSKFCINQASSIDYSGSIDLNEIFVFSYKDDSYVVSPKFISNSSGEVLNYAIVGGNLDTKEEKILFNLTKIGDGYAENLRVFRKRE